MGVGNIGIGFFGEVEGIVATAVGLMFMHNSRHRSLFDIVQYYPIEDEVGNLVGTPIQFHDASSR